MASLQVNPPTFPTLTAVSGFNFQLTIQATGQLLTNANTTLGMQVQTLVIHPSVVKVMDWGQEGRANPFLVMERVTGSTLRSKLSEGPLTLEQSVHWLRQLLQGLAAVHQGGIMHRDLKPENLMITGSQNLKIMDLGAAVGTLEAKHAITGTPRYMAPEQADAEGAGPPADVYAAGLVGYEMLTGRLPWDDPPEVTPWTLLTQRRTVAPIPLAEWRSDVPPWLADIIARMLEVDPRRRPVAGDAATALQEV
ncbi:MAG: serine/threonine-protein kinase [Candidatus Xenobia bacterium]